MLYIRRYLKNMDSTQPYLLLEYIYNRFLVPFILVLLGSVLAEVLSHRKRTKVNITHLLSNAIIFTIFTAALSTAQKNITFEAYVAICVLVGIFSWKFKLIKLLFDKTLMLSIIGKLLKMCTEPMAKAASITLEEIEKSESSKKKTTNKKPPDDNSNNNEIQKDDKDSKG